MIKFFLFSSLLILSTSSCSNSIETGTTLSSKDYERLQSLHLLDSNEHLYQFYSEFRKSVAGNFFTDKRLASYWLDQNNTSKNKIEFAWYKDVANIDTVYNAGGTYCPYLLVTRKDSSTFKVCVEGNKKEITAFFNDAIAQWKKARQ